MKKKIIFVASLAAALLYLAHSCANEDFEGSTNDEMKNQLVNKAKLMYYGTTVEDGIVELITYATGNNGNGNNGNGNNGNGNNGNGNNGNGNNGDAGMYDIPRPPNNGNGNNGNGNGNNGNLAVKPMWQHSSVEQNNVYQAVEVILQMEKVFNFVDPEAMEKFKQNKKKEYIQSKTSLIYLVEKKTGKEEMFLMTISPDLSYQEYTKFDPFWKMSYLKRDSKYDGLIFYHNLDGKFVNGWRYKNGKVVATMQAQKEAPDFDVMTTRSSMGWDCVTNYMITYVENCAYWGPGNASGEMLYVTGYSCYSYIESTYYYTSCTYNEVSSGYYVPTPVGTPYIPKGSDKMAKPNLPTTMTPQITGGCVPAIMEYVNNKVFNGYKTDGEYSLSYYQTYGVPVHPNGVSSQYINSFVNMHFTRGNFSSMYAAINAGVVVMTDMPTPYPGLVHNVLVVGYTSPDYFIYMNPEKGFLELGYKTEFGANYMFAITGVK